MRISSWLQTASGPFPIGWRGPVWDHFGSWMFQYCSPISMMVPLLGGGHESRNLRPGEHRRPKPGSFSSASCRNTPPVISGKSLRSIRTPLAARQQAAQDSTSSWTTPGQGSSISCSVGIWTASGDHSSIVWQPSGAGLPRCAVHRHYSGARYGQSKSSIPFLPPRPRGSRRI